MPPMLSRLKRGSSRFALPRFANPRERCAYVAAARAVHSAALAANIIEGNSRVLFYPAEPAPNANARRGDDDGFPCHGCPSVDAGDEIDRAHPAEPVTAPTFPHAPMGSLARLSKRVTHRSSIGIRSTALTFGRQDRSITRGSWACSPRSDHAVRRWRRLPAASAFLACPDGKLTVPGRVVVHLRTTAPARSLMPLPRSAKSALGRPDRNAPLRPRKENCRDRCRARSWTRPGRYAWP